MIRVKIHELNKHRNETTFRPYLQNLQLLQDIGLEFTGDLDADLHWVGQASFIDKKVSLEESVQRGVEFVDSIDGDVILFDGQDSATLMGAKEVLDRSNAKLLLKNTLYSEGVHHYVTPSPSGRLYWDFIDGVSWKDQNVYTIGPSTGSRLDNIKLSGTNWLSTVEPTRYSVNWDQKEYDLCALFSTKGREKDIEHGLPQSPYYEAHRKRFLDVVEKLEKRYKVIRLKDNQKLSQNEYYNTMARSKFVLAPFGYGEMAPRDIETYMFQSILLKPDMSHLDSKPMWYKSYETYIPLKWDASDFEEQFDMAMSMSKTQREWMIESSIKGFKEKYSPLPMVMHMYGVLRDIV